MKIFKISPQIDLDIIIRIGLAGGEMPISSVYEEVRASPAAIRLHISKLNSVGLIEIRSSIADKRRRNISFSENGRRLYEEYIIFASDVFNEKLNN